MTKVTVPKNKFLSGLIWTLCRGRDINPRLQGFCLVFGLILIEMLLLTRFGLKETFAADSLRVT